MFLLHRNNRNYDIIAICYVCYDITRKQIFDVKWKPYMDPVGSEIISSLEFGFAYGSKISLFSKVKFKWHLKI
jgi:hypothetical protein